MQTRSIIKGAGLIAASALLLTGAASGDSKPQAKAKGGFVWTENPTLDKAPAGPLSANLDGQTVELKNILIESGEKSWKFTARADGDALAVGPRLALFQTPAVGVAQSSKLADGCRGSFLQLAEPARGPKETTSYNSACAFTIEFSKWEVKPFDKTLRRQKAGTASGRLVAVWKGGAGHKDNWIAGTFTDVPVHYGSERPLCALSCSNPAKYNPGEWTAKATPVAAGKAVKLAWGPKPVLEMAPAAGVSAELNGTKLQLPAVEVVGGDKNWVLTLQAPTDSGTSMGAAINLWQTPTTGALFKKELNQHVGPPSYAEYFVDAPDPKSPKEVVQWTGELAYAVQFTKWETQPYSDATKDHEAGKASGRVVVMMKGEEDSKNSWIAGTFTDAPISYRNEPPLCAKACMAE